MNFDQVSYYLDNSINFGCVPGLSRIEKLLELLGNPHNNLKCIHVAGTNGKGSTSAMISSILEVAGYKTAMYSSPHLYSITERMTINGQQISEAEFAYYASLVIEKIDFMNQHQMDEPTQFEMLTAMAFYYFADKKVDFAVIETGLGGNYDATNIIDSIISVITSISYDHMDILGDTIEKIAAEKAGIIKKNSITIMYPQLFVEADKTIAEQCKNRNSQLIRVGPLASTQLQFSQKGQIFDYVLDGKSLKNIKIPLIGQHQLKNAAVAITTVLKIADLGYKIKEEAIFKGLEQVEWPCRLSIVSQNPLILIDGAHNEDGIDSLKTALKMYFSDKRIVFVIGMLKDKNYEHAVNQLIPLAEAVVVTEPNSDRKLDAALFAALIEKKCSRVIVEKEIKAAIEAAKKLYKEDILICICGSLYLAGEAYKYIKENK